MNSTVSGFSLSSVSSSTDTVAVGFRTGPKGTHSSRTMMLNEVTLLFEATRHDSRRADYAAAIIEANCLSKPTTSSRRLTNQRLGELYGLDPAVPLFRVFRRLWDFDSSGRALLALLTSLARDPLLAVTAPMIASLLAGAELQRELLRRNVRTFVGPRLNENILDKVCRNIASSWTQSGHLQGRTFKKRQAVTATPASVAYAIYLAHACGSRGADVFSSGWVQVLDCDPLSGRDIALEAKRVGLLDLRMSGEVVELNLARMDPSSGGN